MRSMASAAIILMGLMAPAYAQSGESASGKDMRELIDATRATAKAVRDNTETARVVPDILTQILAKLDKLEDKLDKIENAVKAGSGSRTSGSPARR